MRATDIPKVPYTLLLADDSVTIQRVIELTFADEDIQVIAVSDGDQAIQRLDASPPDIVLADIGMPGRNGYEVAQYIKQSPRLAHIPVVLLTGAFEPVDHARASEAGCDGVLAKPFEPQLVIGRVKDLLARPRPVLEAPAESPAPTPVADAHAEPSAPMPVAEAHAESSAPMPTPAALDAYFDRLDTAFSNLAAAPPPSSAPAPPTAPAVAEEIDWFGAAKTGAAEPAPEWDVRAPAPVDEAPDLPLSFSRPAAPPEVSEAVDEPPVASEEMAQEASAIVEAPAAAPEEPAPPVPVEEVAPPPVLVEQDPPTELVASPEPVAPAAALAPIALAPEPAPAAHALPALADAFAALLAAEKSEGLAAASPAWPAAGPSASLAVDEVVEQVTRRVLTQLSDRIVRETVADLVSSIAERLVREEIERIKGTIQ